MFIFSSIESQYFIFYNIPWTLCGYPAEQTFAHEFPYEQCRRRQGIVGQSFAFRCLRYYNTTISTTVNESSQLVLISHIKLVHLRALIFTVYKIYNQELGVFTFLSLSLSLKIKKMSHNTRTSLILYVPYVMWLIYMYGVYEYCIFFCLIWGFISKLFVTSHKR